MRAAVPDTLLMPDTTLCALKQESARQAARRTGVRAGEPIATRWTAAHKAEIKRSRVAATQAVVNGINALPQDQRPKVLVSTSAVGEQQLTALLVVLHVLQLARAASAHAQSQSDTRLVSSRWHCRTAVAGDRRSNDSVAELDYHRCPTSCRLLRKQRQ